MGTPPAYVGSDYYANQVPRDRIGRVDYHEDPLWDGQQCGGLEANFCKTFATTISGDIEVRLCGNQDLQDENMHCSSGVFRAVHKIRPPCRTHLHSADTIALL